MVRLGTTGANRMMRAMIRTSRGRRFLMRHMSALLCALAGCSRPPPPPAPPPPAVTVSRPLVREVIEWDEYTGRLSYVSRQEVRARVSGLIQSAPFKEGSNVKKGDVLFVIDARPFKADLEARIADTAKAKAQLEQAASDL